MVKRPLKNRRPIGPFVDFESDSDNANTVKQATTESKQAETQQTSVNEEEEKVKPHEIDDPILQTAEKWYQSIAKEENKRKMMRNYFRSMTDLPDEEIKNRLDEAGL
jgi:catalase